MGTSVIVVDDDDLLRRSPAFSLERAGFEVRTAASAEDAIAMTAQNRPDIVLLDIMLPGKDGLEALRLKLRLRTQYRDRGGRAIALGTVGFVSAQVPSPPTRVPVDWINQRGAGTAAVGRGMRGTARVEMPPQIAHITPKPIHKLSQI